MSIVQKTVDGMLNQYKATKHVGAQPKPKTIELPNMRTYKTESILMNKIHRANLDSIPHLVMKTVDDRFTTVFVGRMKKEEKQAIVEAGFALV